MLKLIVNNIFTDIIGDIPDHHWKQIEKSLSFRPEGYVFHPLYNRMIYKNGKRFRLWDGWKRQIWKNKKRTYFPSGLYSIVTDYLKENNIVYSVTDNRIKPVTNFDVSLSSEFIEREYQARVCNDAVEKQRGIIQAATGSGKTFIGAGIIARLKVSPFLFFVTSIDLLCQARSELSRFLVQNGRSISVGQIGGGTVEFGDVNVVTVQTAVRALGKQWDSKTKFDDEDEDDPTPIQKYRTQIVDLLHNAKGAAGDEIQHWKSETCQIVTRSLENCYYIYGLSATPYRDEGDDMMIQACFGKYISRITASELIQTNDPSTGKSYLMKPQIMIVHLRGDKTKFSQWQSVYKDQVVENEYYNNTVANISNAYINQNRLVLVLVTQINHGKHLESLIHGSLFVSGKSSKQNRINALNKLRNKDIKCIISTTIFDEGINVRALDTIVLAGQGKSKVRAMQRIGRILRPCENKPNPVAIDFKLYQPYLRQHADARVKMYSTEPEFIIRHIDPKNIIQ